MLHKNTQTDRWERAHSNCAQSDGADQSSYPPRNNAPSLTPKDGAAAAMTPGLSVNKEVLRKDDDGFTQVLDMDCHLHMDAELKELGKEFHIFMTCVSERLQEIDTNIETLRMDLTSSNNRQAAAQEEMVKVLKSIHDLQLKFGQK